MSGPALAAWLLIGCGEGVHETPVLNWYVFDEPSGAFAEAARRCAEASEGAYRVVIKPLPADADQQREQLVRRLAARDSDIDIIGMDVIWTAEFAAAGWILPWPQAKAREAREGRIGATVESASYAGRLWAVPFTTNTQLLWYRTDRVPRAPRTWDEMIDMAESLGDKGTIQAQGERYEGLTVVFVSLLASAGGAVLEEGGEAPSLEPVPLLQLGDGALGAQVSGQVASKVRVPAARPFEQHGGVLDLLAHVVLQDASQLWVPAGVGPLAVPVHGLDLLLE